MSDAISFSVGNPTKAKFDPYQNAIDVRRFYERLFEEYPNNPRQVLSTLREVGDLVIKKLQVDCKEKKSDFDGCSIMHDKKTYALSGRPTFFIGRMPGVDLPFPSIDGSSRLHSIVYMLPTGNRIVFVDVGSATGISIKLRSVAEAPLLKSTFINRMPLVFDAHESATIEMGIQTVFLNPKACLVCCSHPSDTRLHCTHTSVCSTCATNVRECPLCHVAIVVNNNKP